MRFFPTVWNRQTKRKAEAGYNDELIGCIEAVRTYLIPAGVSREVPAGDTYATPKTIIEGELILNGEVLIL